MMRLLLLVPAALLAASGCSPARGFCAAQAECDAFEAQFPFGFDRVGEDNDSENVCVAEQEGTLRTLRANEEDVCRAQADALERYMACVANVYFEDEKDACDGLVFSNDNPCDDELDDLFDAINDAEDDCSPNER